MDDFGGISVHWFIVSVLLALSSVGWAQALPTSNETKSPVMAKPTVLPATDGIFAAFQNHSLVGIADKHEMAQEEDFYAALIRDPRFAKDVGNVVVEFGGAAQQETVDHYVKGDYVPYQQLRKVWADTLWYPTVIDIGYVNFLAQIRTVNLALPPSQRIHVWLSDPPVDWSKINTQTDLSKLPDRDQYPAKLIESEILAKRKKALVIYGLNHFYGPTSLKILVEQHYPGAFFFVSPYFGFQTKACSETFEKTAIDWPPPAIATPVHGSALQTDLHAPGCDYLSASNYSFGPNMTEAEKIQRKADMEFISSGVGADALLYLGPAADLTKSPMSQDLFLDEDFRKEIDRRALIRTGASLSWFTVKDNPVSPRYWHSYGDRLK